MVIKLNIEQAITVLQMLENPLGGIGNVGNVIDLEKEVINIEALESFKLMVKMGIKQELQDTEIRFTSMINELDRHGYTEVGESLDILRDSIKTQAKKTEDLYFDEEGNIKGIKQKLAK